VVDKEVDSPLALLLKFLPALSLLEKRRGRGQTPIVDDEVRRSARLRKEAPQKHIQLENEPRRKKGASKKSVTFSSVIDMKKAMVSCNLKESLAEFEVAPIQTPTLVDLGTSFCGVPPSQLNLTTMPHDEQDQ
jgi:hypothetical protein